MFRSTTVKLTAIYLGITAIVCIFFTGILYQTASHELDDTLHRQELFFRSRLSLFDDDTAQALLDARQSQINDAHRALMNRLLLIDLAILTAGGIGSYFLARWSLRPIEQSHEAQKRFSADASHQLRTPLATMQAEIEVALRQKNLTLPEAKKLLSSNLEELSKLTTLSAGLLQLAKQERQREKKPIAIAIIINQAIDRVSEAKNKNIHIQNFVSPEMKIQSDPQMLEELLIILLDNAVKYSPADSVVKIEARRSETHIVLAISDQGYGIKTKDLPHIFDRFYRGVTPQQAGHISGHGLGLSIAKRLVETLKGRIEVSSSEKSDTTFRIFLPHKIS